MKFIFFFFVFLLIASVAHADVDFDKLHANAVKSYKECSNSLPSRAKDYITFGKRNGSFSGRVRKKIVECLELRRQKKDIESMVQLATDFEKLNNGLVGKEKSEMQSEAKEISFLLIKTTNDYDKKIKMSRSALWHNFLIKVGAKDGGYCYQWSKTLFRSLPQKPYKYFERHWGVHNEAEVTENNAVLITARGRSVSTGIVYDPWRGRGEPFWRLTSEDSQSWSKRYNEYQIITKGYLDQIGS